MQYRHRAIEVDLWEGETTHHDQPHHPRWVTKIELYDSESDASEIFEDLPAGLTGREFARSLLLERLRDAGERGWRVLYYSPRVIGGETVEWPLGVHFLVREGGEA